MKDVYLYWIAFYSLSGEETQLGRGEPGEVEPGHSLGGDEDDPGEDPPLVPHHLHHPLSYGRQPALSVVDDVNAGLEVRRGDAQPGHHVLPRHADLVVLAVADREPGHDPVTNLRE